MKKTMFVYVVKDIISGSTVLGGVEYTDQRFCNYAMRVYGDSALKEFQVFKVGEWDGDIIKSLTPTFIPWEACAVKETRAENMRLVGASESEKIADFMAQTSDK